MFLLSLALVQVGIRNPHLAASVVAKLLVLGFQIIPISLGLLTLVLAVLRKMFNRIQHASVDLIDLAALLTLNGLLPLAAISGAGMPYRISLGRPRTFGKLRIDS